MSPLPNVCLRCKHIAVWVPVPIYYQTNHEGIDFSIRNSNYNGLGTEIYYILIKVDKLTRLIWTYEMHMAYRFYKLNLFLLYFFIKWTFV